MNELLDFHRRAMMYAVSIVNRIEPEQLSLPTPCAGWDLGRLLDHMTAQDRGFAAAARGDEFDPAAWAETPLSGRFDETFAASADEVVAAFNEAGAAQREWLLLIGGEQLPFPGELAVGFHLLDYVVHAWDVAVSVGFEPEFDPLVLTEVLTIAEQVPNDGPTRVGTDAPFAPALELEGGDGLLDQILALLGRDPEWSADQG